MKSKTENPKAALESIQSPSIKIFGVGSAGVTMLDLLNSADFAGAGFVAVNTDAPSLAASSAPVKIQLETKLLRGLGTGGDPERGGAIAEEQFATLKTACEGADVVFVVAGLGGGAGSGISPVLARAAKEAGALVLAFVTLPFACEGNRRQQQAQSGLDLLKSIADGVICLPCQKTFKLIDENTSVLDTFRITGRLLVESVRGVWCLLTRPGLIRIHFDDLCALVRDRHSESVFASVDATGPARAREVVEKLIAHPLLDEGRALAESGAVLVSLMGGKDLTMAEVDVFMGLLNQRLPDAQVIFGAAIDPALQGRMSVALIASGARSDLAAPPLPAAAALESRMPTSERSAPELLDPQLPPVRQINQFIPPAPALGNERREQLFNRQGSGRARRKTPKNQKELPFDIISRGRFEKCEPTIRNGEDLDVPTFIRRHVVMN